MQRMHVQAQSSPVLDSHTCLPLKESLSSPLALQITYSMKAHSHNIQS